MNISRITGFLAMAALAAGCGVAAPGPSTTFNPLAGEEVTVPADVAVTQLAAPDQAGYSLQSVGDNVKVVNVCASSTFNTYFPTSHVNDGNSHTAWQPLCKDSCPTLTLDVCNLSCITGLDIKQDGSCDKLDVAFWNGRCWETVACGLRPKDACYTHFCLDGCPTTKVMLTFHDIGKGNLFVCDATLCGHCAPTKTEPSPLPTVVLQ